ILIGAHYGSLHNPTYGSLYDNVKIVGYECGFDYLCPFGDYSIEKSHAVARHPRIRRVLKAMLQYHQSLGCTQWNRFSFDQVGGTGANWEDWYSDTTLA